MGGEGGARSAPFGGGNELKKTGARSARARTRDQNPLVCNNTTSGPWHDYWKTFNDSKRA